jgi:hypothetical protein
MHELEPPYAMLPFPVATVPFCAKSSAVPPVVALTKRTSRVRGPGSRRVVIIVVTARGNRRDSNGREKGGGESMKLHVVPPDNRKTFQRGNAHVDVARAKIAACGCVRFARGSPLRPRRADHLRCVAGQHRAVLLESARPDDLLTALALALCRCESQSCAQHRVANANTSPALRSPTFIWATTAS